LGFLTVNGENTPASLTQVIHKRQPGMAPDSRSEHQCAGKEAGQIETSH